MFGIRSVRTFDHSRTGHANTKKHGQSIAFMCT